ncbi:MAG: ATP-binding cassette domain-containing protein [Gammaproteobacteria bacterium]
MADTATVSASATGSDVVLRLTGVDKQFGKPPRVVQALSGVDIEVRRGRVTGLIGPDGAGKTTLMRIATGLLLPKRGEVEVLGFDAARQSLEVQSRVGYMPQRFGLYEDLSVQENLDLYADLQGVAPRARALRYQELMNMTGLAPFTERLAGRLSGGMKQKLGLACTLVHPPELLLLDEPTVGVDPVSRRELWEIVYRLVREQAMSVLLSTAYLDEAERCDEVILLHEGRLLGHGKPDDFSRPLTGRSFAVTAPDIGKRTLQARLAARPGVLDSVIQGEHVRVVLDADAAATPQRVIAELPGAGIEPVPPRFEDAFVTMIRGNQPARQVEVSMTSNTVHSDGKVIEVQHLDRRFGDFYAVRDLSFDVRHGEVFGLLGANGAGKSTTFRMLCGLLPASGGQLSVAGVDLRTAAAAARARIGYMSQKFSLYGNLSVQQNLRFFASAYGLAGKHQRQRIDAALTDFELEGYRDTGSETLPLGYKQRLALACALLHEPDILFLDEPTSGVDPLARREFWARINALAERGVTVLVTTHFMEEAEYCDRMAIMAAGRILALGTPQQIKAKARSAQQPETTRETTMEDAFIALIETAEHREVQADAA